MSSGQQVLIKLRKMIIAREFEGGSRIAEIPTAERLGVSRQPVRMAFRLLEQEGLLVKAATRGYVVRELSDELIHDALEVRGVLEGLAARRLAEKGLSEHEKTALKECLNHVEELFDNSTDLDDNALETFHHYNVKFHKTIIQGAQNVALMQALAKNNQLPMASVEAITYDGAQGRAEYRRLHYAHLQHCLIYDALLQGDATRAESLMREHSRVVFMGDTLNKVLPSGATATAAISD